MEADDAARWDSAIAELSHRVESAQGYLLALVVGAGETLRGALIRDLGARLAPGFEVRPVAVTAEQPNPLAGLMEEAGIERQLILVYGLGSLSTDDRKHALHMLNWARSQLTRRPMKIVLWVEPDVVVELYQFAGDFADWWTVLIELPGTAPQPKDDPFVGRSRWELGRELQQRWTTLQRARDAGDVPPPELESTVEHLFAAVQVTARPGQVIAGARLTRADSPNLWHAVELETGIDCLVHVVAELERLSGFLWTLDLLRRFERAPQGSPRGVVRLRRVDDRVLAYSTSKPAGDSVPRALTEHGWTTEQRVDMVLAVLDTVVVLERMGMFLRDLRPKQLWLDQDDLPVFVSLESFGQAGDPPDEDLSGLVRGYDSPDDKVLSETRDVYILGLLLVYVVSGRRFDKPTLQWMKKSADPMSWALGQVAAKATRDDPVERFSGSAGLRRALVFTRSPIVATCHRWMPKVYWALNVLVDVSLLVFLVYFIYHFGLPAWNRWTGKDLAPTAAEIQIQLTTAQQQLETLQRENADLKAQVQTLTDALRALQSEQTPPAPQPQ